MESGYPAGALAVLADRLHSFGGVWVVGGSTGLAVRGAQLARAPRDLDVYADEEDIPILHRQLDEYASDKPVPSETSIYRSTLSHYSVEGTVVELVGGFRIAANGTRYRTEVRQMLHPCGDTFIVNGRGVRLVPLAHELLFNVLREREDRAELIGDLIRREPEHHVPILKQLMERNDISRDTAERLRRFTSNNGSGMKAGME